MSVWELDGESARLTAGRLTGRIDLRCSQQGIADLRWGGQPLACERMVGLALRRSQHGEDVPLAESTADRFIRGSSLLATYSARAQRPVQTDVAWTVTGDDEETVVIDVVVSVRTDLAEAQPGMVATSRLRAGRLWRLIEGGFEPVNVPPVGSPHRIWPEAGPACLLVGLASPPVSYAEMLHPADFDRWDLGEVRRVGSSIQVEHHLFPEPLEKGVIVRARLRGVFLAERGAGESAAAIYRSFCGEKPPLSA